MLDVQAKSFASFDKALPSSKAKTFAPDEFGSTLAEAGKENSKEKMTQTSNLGRSLKNDKNHFKKGSLLKNVDKKLSDRESGNAKKDLNSNYDNHQIAMQSFMDSMESELGVTPDRIVAAWAKMSQSELNQSPEESKDQFIANLGLPNEGKDKVASQLYQNLLAQTNGQKTELVNSELSSFLDSGELTNSTHQKLNLLESPLGENLKINSDLNIKANSGLEVESDFNSNPILVQNSQGSFAKENNNVASESDSMNSNSEVDFASSKISDSNNRDNSSDEQWTSESEAQALQNSETEIPKPDIHKMNSVQRRQYLNKTIDQMNDRFFKVNNSSESDAVKSKMIHDSNMNPADAIKSNFKTANTELNMFNPINSASGNQNIDSEWNPLGDQTQSLPKANLDGDASSSLSQGFSSESEEDSKSEFSQDRTFQDQVYNTLKKEWNENNLGQVKSTSLTPMNDFDKMANLKRIMDQAQILTQSGGGEVRMKLSPEGIGDVHLKVVVQNGKVDLEFKTQNKEVQNLLENNLNDLKTQLSHHKLSVDNVQVDVATQDNLSQRDQMMRDMSQQQWEQSREQARQFMGQFRENNFFNRQNLMDDIGINGFRDQRRDDLEPNPIERSAQARANSLSRGTGLNLVA